MIILIFIDSKHSAFSVCLLNQSHFLIRCGTLDHSTPFEIWYLFVYPSFSLTYDIYLSRSSSTNLAISICSLVFHVFIFRVYLTLVKAVTLILKHATLSRISMSPESALTNADQKYQKGNIDVTIQQHLAACTAEQSVEQFVGFIMSTDIGLFIFLPFIISISYFYFRVITVLSSHWC
jgi:hypothetical protein